jgi:hypothetical protein
MEWSRNGLMPEIAAVQLDEIESDKAHGSIAWP